MQPVYGLTFGLTNKTVTKYVKQLLEEQPLAGEYLPDEIREKYQLADYNFSIRTFISRRIRKLSRRREPVWCSMNFSFSYSRCRI